MGWVGDRGSGWLLAIPRNELNDVLVHFFDESVEFRQDTDFMDERT